MMAQHGTAITLGILAGIILGLMAKEG